MYDSDKMLQIYIQLFISLALSVFTGLLLNEWISLKTSIMGGFLAALLFFRYSK